MISHSNKKEPQIFVATKSQFQYCWPPKCVCKRLFARNPLHISCNFETIRIYVISYLNFVCCLFCFVLFGCAAINPDGYSLCPTASTEMATGTDASGNGNGNGSAHSNDIASTHQESCLWPNALQVCCLLLSTHFVFGFVFTSDPFQHSTIRKHTHAHTF